MRRNHSTVHTLTMTLFLGVLLLAGFCNSTLGVEKKGWDVQLITCNPLLGQLEMDSTWEAAKAIGIKGIEFTVSSDLTCSTLMVGKETPYRMDTPENAEKIKKDAAAQGLVTPVICAGIPLDPKAENKNTVEIKAPMVGTFYRAPSPEAPPYVNIGDMIEPGQVVCIVEAMKLMNEIKSEVKGKIVDIMVDNAEPVEFGQALFVIEPS